ncbi:MAG: hypothetical protein AB1714_10015 [Acidobacteriota bacterium]
MKLEQSIIGRLTALVEEIRRLGESEFPYPYSESALKDLRAFLEAVLERIKSQDELADKETVRQACRVALQNMVDYLPIAGFLLRSTNVRNAFEVVHPLFRMAATLLEPGKDAKDANIRLLLSSEWDYSPFIYRLLPALPGYVLIGLPAPESANPLLIPLAGHELGHSVWLKYNLQTELQDACTDAVVQVLQRRSQDYNRVFPYKIQPDTDLRRSIFHLGQWRAASEWTLQQAEESFADFIGLHLFGFSFLYAFAYLLSPGLTGRSESYPSSKARLSGLERAAQRFNVAVPREYADLFDCDLEDVGDLSETSQFLLSVADEARDILEPRLIERAADLVAASSVQLSSEEETNRILERFKLVAPAEHCRGLADIFNAGWLVAEDPGFWKELPVVHERRDEILKELVLKNIEVFEVEWRMRRAI